jgi:hypothetical protein
MSIPSIFQIIQVRSRKLPLHPRLFNFKFSGYARMGGTKATAEELERMLSVMEQNGLLRHTRILTGTSI